MWLNILDVHTPNRGSVLTAKLHHIHPTPSQVACVWPHKDFIMVNHVPQAINLDFGFNYAAHMVVEASTNPFCQGNFAYFVEGVGELLIFIIAHAIVGVNMPRYFVARQAACGDIIVKSPRCHIEFCAAYG